MTSREFHYSDGKSNKFWAIRVEDRTHILSWGRIGTAGQTKTKEFSTREEARQGADKIIQSKLRDGYREVQSGAGSPDGSAAVAESSSPPSAPERMAMPPASPSAPVATSAVPPQPLGSLEVTRSLNLEPDDWLWATWRPRVRRERAAPRPFDNDQALKQISRLPTYQGEISWYGWGSLKLPASLSREEAHFWLAAIVESYKPEKQRIKMEELIQKLKNWTFHGDVPAEEAKAALDAIHAHIVPEAVVAPLVNLFTVEELFTHLPWEKLFGQYRYQGVDVAFHTFLLPYLTEEELDLIRRVVRPAVHPSNWPLSTNQQNPYPPSAFFVAAQVGLHEEVRAIVEIWSDDA